MVLHQRQEGGDVPARLFRRFVHLPIGDDEFFAHKRIKPKSQRFYLFVNASTPGSFLPSRNSSDAPPPVEMWVILSATPAAWTAATESPPPTIDVAPALAAMAWAIFIVPWANGATSKTPMGPFHTMVFAEAISLENAATVFGPISRPILSAGMSVTT